MANNGPVQALARLRSAADSGQLDAFAQAHDLRLLVVFGSAATGAPMPRDLDIAFLGGEKSNTLLLLDGLVQLTNCGQIDLLDLDRAGIVATARALSRCIPLFESEAGLFAARQVNAGMQFADTQWLRDAQLRELTR